MTDIRLICLDMDGTLLDDDHATVPARNVRALRAAAARGAAVAIASGRAWSLLREAADQVGAVRYAVQSNGAAVLDVETGEGLYRSCTRFETSLILRYHTQGILGLLRSWTESDTKNLDEIVHTVFRLMTEGSSPVAPGQTEGLDTRAGV